MVMVQYVGWGGGGGEVKNVQSTAVNGSITFHTSLPLQLFMHAGRSSLCPSLDVLGHWLHLDKLTILHAIP